MNILTDRNKGVPGVGKTSTAECVAAQTKRPLFPITCGDIGTTAEEVEKRLEEYFDLAHKWGCVLLLDEADVYLATREKGGDLQRNSLVSGMISPRRFVMAQLMSLVFLRVLEYYSGTASHTHLSCWLNEYLVLKLLL